MVARMVVPTVESLTILTEVLWFVVLVVVCCCGFLAGSSLECLVYCESV